MSFYIRKSVSVGPLRFNISKSGIGVSSGIRGFRVGAGPRGNYIHLGRGGLYYRRTLAPPRPRRNERAEPFHPSTTADETSGPMEMITSGSASRMVDSSSAALIAELNRKQKRWRAMPIVVLLSLILFGAAVFMEVSPVAISIIAVPLVTASIATYYWDMFKKSVVMMYDLDDETTTVYRDLHEVIGTLRRVGSLWHIDARGDIHDPKYHAGAEQLVRRKHITIDQCDPPFVRTNVAIHRIPTGNGALYFCPDMILFYANHGIGAISYDDLRLEFRSTQFIEDGPVPKDTRVVDRTWRYVNKKGGPDKRFKDNRELPICEYEELHLRSSSGLNELFQASRTGLGSEINLAVQRMAVELASAKLATTEHGAVMPSYVQSPRPPSQPPRSENTDGKMAAPALQDVHEALFRLLCCVMVADGRASSVEKARITELMRKTGASWDEGWVSQKIGAFINDVQIRGFNTMFEEAMSGVSLFQSIGRPDVLIKCVDSITASDRTISEAEKKILKLIRRELDNGSSSARSDR